MPTSSAVSMHQPMSPSRNALQPDIWEVPSQIMQKATLYPHGIAVKLLLVSPASVSTSGYSLLVGRVIAVSHTIST
jgi:hypothetical protein